MTYSIEVINLCIYHYNNKRNKFQISKLLNINCRTFANWFDERKTKFFSRLIDTNKSSICSYRFSKYNYYFINNIYLTLNDYNNIKNENVRQKIEDFLS